MKIPRGTKKSKPPKLPVNAMPDREDIIPGAEIPTTKCGIPQGSTPPFWVTMTTIPYLFPTASPWFNIPDFLTIHKMDYIKQVHHPGSKFSTIMLTGLPEGNYTHEEVAKLVWRYFPQQTLNSLYYNLLVLPLQRRAFVYFCDRDACSSFVQDHIKNPVSVRDFKLSIHFVLEDMHPGSSEEVMYRTLMKWSNAHVPELERLEERLLCVEISETNVDLIKWVVKEVASVASFVNFLPLANRICIEMVGSSGVAKVVEEILSRKDLTTHKTWSKVGRVETLRSLKQRLQDSSEISVNLEVDATCIKARPSPVKVQPPSSEPSRGGAQSASAKPEAMSQKGAAELLHAALASKAHTDSTAGIPQPGRKNSAGTYVMVEETAAQTQNVPSKSTISENRTDAAETFNPKKVSEPSGVPKDTDEVVVTRNGTAPQVKQQAEHVKVHIEIKDLKGAELVKGAEPPELKEAEEAEPVETEGSAESTDAKTLATKPGGSRPPTSTVPPPKPTTDPPESLQTTVPDASVTASPQVQQRMIPDPESKTEALQKQQRAAGSSAGAAVEVEKTVREAPTKTTGKAVLTEASAKSEPTAAAATYKQPAATASSPADDSSATVGERIGSLLHVQRISFHSMKMIMSPKYFSVNRRLILITNLPKYHDDCYTEADVADLLRLFGFQYEDKTIFVIPQTCMAFALMPSLGSVQRAIKAFKHNPITLNGSRLYLQVVSSRILLSPFGFYKSLMELIHFQVTDDGASVIYINNISPSESRELREALRKIDSVRNYLPLLNKVFIEFESIRDADRLGVWYSLLKRCPANNVYRMKIPRHVTSAPPRLAAKALPDSSNIVTGAVAPTTKIGLPQGSAAPFSVTLTTAPFVFPTVSPWFIIPNFLTVKNKRDIWKAGTQGSKVSTIMLTGLPEGNYTHEDVAKLVWRYFPKQNLHTLYYKVLVLPLQRRAFVYFNNFESCCNFIEDQSRTPVSVKGSVLNVHLVLEQMDPGSSEEIMYRSMMKWSNTHVPELESLEERLLCVEMSETSVYLIIVVMKAVLSVAPFVSFLPLANRISIEMVESSGVTQVLENISRISTLKEWSKVRHVESLKSLKQRLQDSGEITINLEAGTTGISDKPPAVKNGAQPLRSEISDKGAQPASAKPAASVGSKLVTSDISVKETAEKVGTRITAGSTVAPMTSGVEENVEMRGKANVVPASEAEAAWAAHTPQPGEGNSAVVGAGMKKKVGGTAAKTKHVPSKSAVSENKPDAAETFNPKASSQVQQSTKPKPESTTQELNTRTNASQSQPQAAGSSAEATLKTEREQNASKGVRKVSAVPSGAAASGKAEQGKKAAAAESKKHPGATTSTAADTSLTPGERIASLLNSKKFNFISKKNIMSPKIFLFNSRLVLIDNLPEYYEGCYTEADFVNCLSKFKVQCEGDANIIIPQSRMAFVHLPSMDKVQEFFRLLKSTKGIIFKGSQLSVRLVGNTIPKTMFELYKRLMKLIKFGTNDDGTRTVYIQNITPSETSELRKALRKMGFVKNFLPLLNKVFIEFECCIAADRLGVWYSLLKRRTAHNVYRMRVPKSPTQPPSQPELTMADSSNIVAGATIPTAKCGVPGGCTAPFWITMTTSPYIFPTMSPWFNIPVHQTVSGRTGMVKPFIKGAAFFTIMLTSLPDETYTHEDVVKLVWNYFPEQNLHSLYYRVMVLPLQRRAFVYFSKWDMCCKFAQNHLKNPLSVKGSILNIHMVLENMDPGNSEEITYRSLMKWSNVHVSNLESLEERLLCVEVSGMDVVLIMAVMKEVACIASFVRFLPLANRIYIEMEESSGVTKVVENISASKPSETWKKVGRIEPLKSRKHRLQQCEKIAVNLELGTVGVYTKPPPTESETQPSPSDEGAQPAPQTSTPAPTEPAANAGATISKCVTAGPSGTVLSDPVMKERHGTEIPAAPAIAPKTSEDVEMAEEGKEESPTRSALPATSLLTSEEDVKELPHIDEDSFNAIKAMVHKYRLTRETPSKDQEIPDQSDASSGGSCHEHTPRRKPLDIQTAVVSSDPFDDENFSIGDFVTVDEISEDVEDAAGDDSSASHKRTSREKRQQKGSDLSSSAKKTQEKSQTKPSSSASVSTTSSSSSQSAETSVSSGLKAQPSKAKSHAPSTGRSSRSSVEMRQSRKFEVKPTERAVSAESGAAQTVESEIKIETSSEMDPPAQRRELESTNQTQSLKTDFKEETPKEVKTSKDGGRKEDDDGKQTEEEGDDGDDYRILDSLDDAADEQMAEEEKQDRSTETQTSGPEPGQRSHEKDHQVSVEDQGKSCLEQCIKMETDASNQVQNSIMKDPEAAVQEDSDLIKDGSSTVNQVSEGVMTSAVNSSDKSSLTSSTNQVMDKDTNQIPQTRGEGGRLKHKEEEVLSQEFCKTTTDDEQISQDKNHPLEDRDNKDTLKDFTEQEAFETVDSVDDQTVTEGDSQKPETPGEQISEGNIEPTEEDAYQVIDSVEDQPTTTETEADGKEDETKKDNVTAERDDRPNRRSGLRTGTCKSEEKEKSPKKPDRTAEKNKSPRKDSTTGKDKHVVENTEEMVYEVVDSVEDESVQETSTTERSGRRRTTRGNKDHKTTTTIHKEVPERPAGEEETEFKILDSVEDEVASDEPTVTRRSTRARREKAKKDAENEKPNKDKTPTGRRTKSARDSGDRNKEKATETEATTPPEENTQTKKSECVVGNAAEEEATYEILDAVEEEAAGEDRPATPEKPRRGRPKKDVKTTRKQPAAVKKEDSSSRRADEEEAIYQILDSVEDEPVRAPIDQSKNVSQLAISKDDDKTKGASSLINEEEEEPVYHIVDSLEDDQVQEELMTTQVSSTKRGERSEAVLEITTKDEAAAKEDSITSDSTAVEVSKEEVEEEKSLLQLADDVEKVGDDPSAAEGSGTGEEDRTPKTDVKKEDRPATVSRCDAATSEKKQKMAKRNETVAAESALVNLDEVSEEEDDYPDDTAEEEELKKKQAAAKERKKEQEERRSRARGETKREQRIQSSSSGVRARRAKERDLEKVEVDNQELVTLDEVGEDEASEEGAIEGGGWDRELLEGELQELVTLDEIVEEGEEGKEEQRTLERLPVRQEGQSADLLKPENQATLAEAGGDEDKKADEDQAEKTTMSAKRKHGDDDTGESVNFVTVDEVGKSEEEQEAATTRTKGRPKKKRSRQTPVRKYARGNTLSKEDEEKEPVPAASLDSSSTPDKDASALSNDVQLEAQKKEVGAANQSDVVAASAGQQPQSERPDNKTLEGGVEGQRGKEGPNRADFKVTDKRRRELVGPEAKRSRSLSPCVAADFKLPPFNPRSPLGQEFVVPKSGFFCNLCSVFYLNESAAKETHCSSQTHYNNLLKHYQKLQQKTAALTHASQSSVSD